MYMCIYRFCGRSVPIIDQILFGGFPAVRFNGSHSEMSPASLGAGARNNGIEVMRSSNVGDNSSGFSNSNESGSSMDFETPHFARSRSAISRPRFVKVRKSYSSLNNRSFAGSGSGFNSFAPAASENSAPVPSGYGLGVYGSAPSGFWSSGNEAFVFGGDRSSDSSSISGKCDGSNGFEKGIVGEMRNLRVGSGDESVNSNANVGGIGVSVFGARSDDKRRLSIGSSRNVGVNDNIENSGFVFGNGVVSDGNDNGGFVFGSGRKVGDSFVQSSPTMIPEQKMNLNGRDSLNTCSVENSEVNVSFDNDNENFCFVGSKTSPACLGGKTEIELSDEMGRKMKIGIEMGNASGGSDMGFGKSVPVTTDFSFQGEIPMNQPKVDPKLNVAAASSFSSSGGGFQSSGKAFEVPARAQSRPAKKDGFGFMRDKEGTGTPFLEFKAPNLKGNLCPSINQTLHITTKMESVKGGKRRKGKSKQRTSVQLQLGEGRVSRGSSQETQEAFGSYSPVDISSYQEMFHNQLSRGTSVASDESLSLEPNLVSTDLHPTVSNAATAPQRMDSADSRFTDTKEEGSEYSDRDFGAPDDSISMVETESFQSAVEETDFNSDVAVNSSEFEASSIPSIERKDSIGRSQLGFPPIAEDMAGSNFTFATSSTAQGQLTPPKRYLQRKKSWGKVGPDAPKLTPNAKVPYMSSTSVAKFFPYAEASSISSHRRGHKGDLSTFQRKSKNNSEVYKGHEFKNGSNLASTPSTAAQEACEKWRLRGNQAYANGHLSRAEDYYTEGVNCIPKSETSRSCLRALMLCYSNRAAIRMSLGKMRHAIADCMAASTIDPNFLKVQVRAANCYLALGEVEDASRYYTICVQSGSDCVDRKIAVEASDGLQKAQKVSECMRRCANLLEKKTTTDGESAREMISEALLISSYSEKLLEMKSEALFMLRRYEEVIQLCEQTFDYAEKNVPLLDPDGGSDNSDASETSEDCNFWIWRCRMIFNSYFQLGRLEEAVASMEKHDERRSFSKRKGNYKTLESSVSLAATVRELLRHKAAGNEAFQAGRHAEAIEHYTAALSCNVESHTFAAICYCNRAAAYNSMGQIIDAIADCSLAIALDGNYLKAISRRATLFEMIRDYGQAASDIRRLVTVLARQVEEKSNNQSGVSERSTSLTNDLKHAQLRLSEVEEKARREIPLDMYLILGVEPSVSAADVKKAYRKAALRHHPDKAGQALARSDIGDELAKEVHRDADKLFKMIGQAYAVLSDPTKRSWYDAEEEVRITRKKRNGNNTPRTYSDPENYPFQRSISARQWREVWRSSAGAAYRGGSESFRGNRY